MRIAHNCNLIPRGLYQTVEDERSIFFKLAREIEPIEEGKIVSFNELKSLENWLHYSVSILNEGRVTHFKPEELPEEMDEEQFLAIAAKKDPYEPRLKPLSLDKPPIGLDKAWQVVVKGDSILYDVPGRVLTKASNDYIFLKSNHWPGFSLVFHVKISLFQKGKWTSIYVGYGHKFTPKLVFPYSVPDIQDEIEQRMEQPEPNFPAEKPKEGEEVEEES